MSKSVLPIFDSSKKRWFWSQKYNFIKQTKSSSIKQGQYDLESGHTLLPYLNMYKFYEDNIGYVLLDPKTKSLIIVDAGEFEKSRAVVEELEEVYEAKLRYIFTTHGHWDHVNGNEPWKQARPDLEIISGHHPEVDIPYTTAKMNDLDTMTIGDLTFACLNVPGHTKEHVAYVVTHVTETSTKVPFLFCADTLFIGGWGRVFTGTAEQLYYSLHKLINLPYDTLVFCGHEYTKTNLKFAKFLDPEN